VTVKEDAPLQKRRDIYIHKFEENSIEFSTSVFPHKEDLDDMVNTGNVHRYVCIETYIYIYTYIHIYICICICIYTGTKTKQHIALLQNLSQQAIWTLMLQTDGIDKKFGSHA
jgi:hypothetical protein